MDQPNNQPTNLKTNQESNQATSFSLQNNNFFTKIQINEIGQFKLRKHINTNPGSADIQIKRK